MLLTIKRADAGPLAILGELFIDNNHECYTLERASGNGKGPIPVGTYKVTVDFSSRFHRPMPHILDVVGFEGIRIHSGNTDKDTEGCILLGTAISGPDFVSSSKRAFNQFFPKLQTAIVRGEEVTIEIS